MSPRLFVRPAMIDLKLEEQWKWGTGRGEKTHPHALLSPSLLPTFTPLGTNSSLSPAVRCCKNKKMAAIIFSKKVLNTRSPKLRLLYGLRVGGNVSTFWTRNVGVKPCTKILSWN